MQKIAEIDPEAARRACAAVVNCALKDAKGRRGGDRVEAIAWLASTKATKYLDLLNIPQSTLLTRSGWMDWAYEILNEDENRYTDTIVESLLYLESLQARQVSI